MPRARDVFDAQRLGMVGFQRSAGGALTELVVMQERVVDLGIVRRDAGRGSH